MARRRNDQQPTRVPTDLPYGQAGQIRQAQQVVPLPNNATTAQPSGGGPQLPPAMGPNGQPLPAGNPLPANMDAFGPTDRPDEPMTAGMPFGPGPNGPLLPKNNVARLEEIYMRYPSPGLRWLLDRYYMGAAL